MNAFADVSPATVAPSCAHCGLPVPRHLVHEAEPQQFCCAGCRQVFTLIGEWNFGQYYRLLDQQRALTPAKVSGRSFEDLDDASAQAAATESAGGERRKTRLYLEGVHCAACVWLVEKLPAVLPGVDEVRLHLGTAVAEVTWHPAHTRLSTVARALDRLGYTPHLYQASHLREMRRVEDRAMLARLGVAAACAMNLMFVSGALYAGESTGMAAAYQTFFRWFSLIISVPVVAFAAKPFFQTAIGGLRAGTIHLDAPIALGITVGMSASAFNVIRGHGPLWFDSLTMLIAALLAARQLQRSAQRTALERADSLRSVAFVEFARRLDPRHPGEPAVEVPISALGAGDRVEIRSGELIPVDGVVMSGSSTLDNAVLTGESLPVPVAQGDQVFAGATNLGARVVVRVDAIGSRTRVGALLRIVDDALQKKPALLAVTDTLSRRFVTALLMISASLLVVLWSQRGPEVALSRVVALLVVSCPCALGLSVPLAMSVALMRAARAGIFVKNPDAFERLRHVGTVCLDKTGTLTQGRPTVAQWHGDEATLEMARALESQSAHAVARAFQQAGGALRLVRVVEQVAETAGAGIAGRLDGHDVRVGHRAHLSSAGVEIPQSFDRQAQAFLDAGLSPVFVSIDGRAVGLAGVGDALRADSRQTVDALRARGWQVCILSGDHPRLVAQMGEALGLPAGGVHGGLTPEAKRDAVTALKARADRSGAVVMVGDGINDAAALASADVGIAVHGGSGATIVAADVVFARDGVRPVLELLDGARRLRGIVARNIGFALLYNAAASTLAIAGLVAPLMAAVLMPASSLVVVGASTFTPTFKAPTTRRLRPAERS